MAAVHGFMSLALLSPAYYGKYFEVGGRLNLSGEIAVTVGVLALFVLLGAGKMPPISLVAVIVAILPLAVRRFGMFGR